MLVKTRSRTLWVSLFVVSLAQLLWFLSLSSHRLIARDEGFYVLAAKLILEGKQPYLDFFYPQMPLLPYLYAIWMKLFGVSWSSARALSAITLTLTGSLLFYRCLMLAGLRLAAIGLLLFVTSIDLVPWSVTVQTYSIGTAFLFASYLCFVSQLRERFATVMAGVFFGLAVSNRLLFAGLAPLIMGYVFKLEAGSRLSRIARFSTGAFMGLLPVWYFCLSDFDLFLYNNLGYHLSRSSISTAEKWNNKRVVFETLLALRATVKYSGIQYALLFYLSSLGLVWSFKRRPSFEPAYLYFLGLFLINFAPTPTYVQYFAATLPFLIVTTVYSFKLCTDYFRSVLYLRLGLLAFLVLYLWHVRGDFDRYLRTGEGVIGIMNQKNADYWNIPNVRAISKLIDRHAAVGAKVISYWPGYLLETQAQIQPFHENHFGFAAAKQLSEIEQSHYRVITKAKSEALIANAATDLVLIDRRFLKKRLLRILAQGGYEKVAMHAPIVMFKRELGSGTITGAARHLPNWEGSD